MLGGKTVVIGVSGGIAAYKVCALVSMLKKANAEVHVAMTENATRFVTPLTFETLSGNRVVWDMWNRDFPWEVEHISLAKKADIFVLAPATANIIAKYANGIADDFLSTTLLAAACPVLIAPAMNTNMYNAAATRENMTVLKNRGCFFIEPGEGRLACGDSGKGRLAEPQEIFDGIVSVLCPKRDYDGKTVLVTAGATREPIDPVRYISNSSSGKMGSALCTSLKRRGAKVILVAGSMSVDAPAVDELIRVDTAKAMYDAVMSKYGQCDVIIKAAAPADYAAGQKPQKIKSKTLTLELHKNPDIAAAVGKVKGERKLVIFCAETQELKENARKKLASKNADMVIANDVTKEGAGFNVDTNIVTVITKDKEKEYGKMLKSELAEIILDEIAAI